MDSPHTLARCAGRGAGPALAFLLVMASDVQSQNPESVMQPAAEQRVVLITGSTDGLGREVARRSAAGGAYVIVHGRNSERGHAVVDEIRAAGGSATFLAADFASLDGVRAFADTLRGRYERIDVLVNNAGIWWPNGERQVSADGHEMHFAVNYLAGFLLTHELLPLLERGRAARIVNVASAAQTPLDFDDVMLERSYSGSRAYAQSKLAQVLFTVELAERLSGSAITVVALHPATLMNTAMVEEAGVRARSTVDEGASAVMRLIDGDIESGAYYNGTRPARASAQAYDAAARARLHELSRRLIGVR